MMSLRNPVEQRLFENGQNSGLTDFVKWLKFLIFTTSGLLTVCSSISHAMPESASDQTSQIPVVVQFDWIFNAQFAGFYQGIEQGFFATRAFDSNYGEVLPPQIQFRPLLKFQALVLVRQRAMF